MPKNCQRFWILLLIGSVAIWGGAALLRSESYPLDNVKNIETFTGSAAAKELLAKNGFVVADPAFKQIFEPYIRSPMTEEPSSAKPRGNSVPSFITTDSAWHTYHVLLEEGIKQIEQMQSRQLLDFSRRLLAAVNDSESGNADLALFASVGLALQDGKVRESLGPEAKVIVDGLRNGTGSINVPIGFPLSSPLFRAQSFYTQSPELTDYFAARQWYASVVFRLSNPRETRLALSLAMLIHSRPELLAAWKRLSEPFDLFLASAKDGTVREYAETASNVLGPGNGNGSLTDRQLFEIQRKLESQLPLARVNDQLLSRDQYLDFAKQTRGFRLLPSRQLPCAICFHETVDPKIPGRQYPSGLDFLAASRVLRSPAAIRAVKDQFGKNVADRILAVDCGPIPDSLHGDAMQLLSLLQKPLPDKVPAPLRTDAWSDLQLWTQLGAWAEQRHTWALHTKLTVSYMGIVDPPEGMVAPYPEFFTGLARLARRSAEALDKAGLAQSFQARAVAADLLEALHVHASPMMRDIDDGKGAENASGKLEQLNSFKNLYYSKHQAELKKNGVRLAFQQLDRDLEALANRCAETGTTNDADLESLRMYFDCRENVAKMMNDFAPVCDRLADLAKKAVAGEALTEDDAKWIEEYGITLATFHFYRGNSYEVPLDNFPIVTRVFSNPLSDSMLYAGLARPQALYLIIPKGGSLQLYRGAVLAYREFVRPNNELLDDESWREMISKGQTPPAPPFTRSFYAEVSATEMLKRLLGPRDAERVNYQDLQDMLWQAGSRATEKDLPELIRVLTESSGDERRDIVDGIADIIGQLPWAQYQKQFIDLLAATNRAVSSAAARILVQRPEIIDAAVMVSNFDHQPTRARRFYCAVLGRMLKQTDQTRKLLLQALRDRQDGVRWQAAMAIGSAGWNDPQSCKALIETLTDSNQVVAMAAVHSLAKLGATNTAPVLFERLKSELQSTNGASGALELQAQAITEEIRGEEIQTDPILDVDRMAMQIGYRVPPGVKQRAGLRLPPSPLRPSLTGYDMVSALIEALRDLNYTPAVDQMFKLRGTDYDSHAIGALRKLAPERLITELLATARNEEIDSYVREQALVTLTYISATNRVREIVPLLDDTTPIVYSRSIPGQEWRVCDRAAQAIAILLGWENQMSLRAGRIRPEQQEAFMTRVREWAKTSK